MATIEEALRTVLIGNVGVSALVGTRVYPVVAPQGASLPAVVYQRISANRQHHLQGPSGLTQVRMQFTAIATTYSAMKALANALRQALDGYRNTVSGVFVQAVLSAGEREQFIGETVQSGAEADMTYSTQLDMLVWHSE